MNVLMSESRLIIIIIKLMAGKKKAILILKGSMKTHWIKYITQLHMHANPCDQLGMGTSLYLLRMLTNVDPKFIQPGFAYTFNIVNDKPYDYPSILDLKFVNGYERKYNLKLNALKYVKSEVEYINEIVEYERAMNGQEDDLEDEA